MSFSVVRDKRKRRGEKKLSYENGWFLFCCFLMRCVRRHCRCRIVPRNGLNPMFHQLTNPTLTLFRKILEYWLTRLRSVAIRRRTSSSMNQSCQSTADGTLQTHVVKTGFHTLYKTIPSRKVTLDTSLLDDGNDSKVAIQCVEIVVLSIIVTSRKNELESSRFQNETRVHIGSNGMDRFRWHFVVLYGTGSCTIQSTWISRKRAPADSFYSMRVSAVWFRGTVRELLDLLSSLCIDHSIGPD